MKINGTILSGVKMGKGFKEALLAPLELKPFVMNESRLEHGSRVIVSSPKKAMRSLTLEFEITASTQADLIARREALYTEFYKGTVYLSELGFTSDVFHLVYTGKSPAYTAGLTNCACKVKVAFDEPNPSSRNETIPT